MATDRESGSITPAESLPGNGKHDVWTHRIAVIGLVICVLMSSAGMIVIGLMGQEIPPALPAIGGTALGALTGMLAAVMKGNP